MRFDTEANLQAWLNSPERQKLLRDAEAFTEEFHARIARTGFDQWFPLPGSGGAEPIAVWKQNMIVLLLLYPVVFLFGLFVQTPLLTGRAEPAVRGRFVHRQCRERHSAELSGAWTSTGFSWWLRPSAARRRLIDISGTALVIALYALMVFVFWRL